MMLTFKSDKEVHEFVMSARRDAEGERSETLAYVSKCRCYMLGLQWIGHHSGPAGGGYSRLVRWATDWVGRSGQIRATINRTTRHTIQVAAATNPARLDVDGLTTDRATGAGDAETADIVESVANVAIDRCGMLAAARAANFERTVAADHGIGLAMEQTRMVVDVNGRETPVIGSAVRAFDFDATRLTLDPHNQSRNLRDHEFVIYSDVLTVHRMRRMFGDAVMARIDEKALKTVGQLMPLEMEFNTLSGGQLYGQYKQHSRTKGAVVHFLHARGGGPDRFGLMYVVIETGGKPLVPGFEDPQSPFGGDGLPYAVIRGHRRPTMRRSISDVGMQLDDQDKLNMIASLYVQQVAAYTGQGKWLADRSHFRRLGEDQAIIKDIQRKNVILYDGASPNSKPPQYVGMPEPSQALEFTMDRMEGGMREQAFRSEVHQGRLKTHQTNRNVQLSVELSELPLDDRITDDVMEYERLISVLGGTAVRSAQQRDPTLLKRLADSGFGPEEFQRLAVIDSSDMPVALRLRQQGLRYRSRSSREQQLYDMAGAGILDGKSVRRVMAGELDMPVSEVDKQVIRFCRQVAERVMYGMEFVPLPLGDRTDIMLEELTRAMTSKAAQQVQGGVERMAMAIQTQEQVLMAQAAALQGPAQPGPGDSLDLAGLVARSA
jgi:hypothetical protein